VRLGRTNRDGRSGLSRMGRVAFINSLLIILFIGVSPAAAEITRVTPGSATRQQNSSVSVKVTTNIVDGIVAVNDFPSNGVGVGRAGKAPTFTFNFQIGENAVPGTYPYTFTDGESLGVFTLKIEAATTTTTTLPPTTTSTTTTTRAPSTTTTTEPPPEITTTSSTTTTTTVPPTTTTSTTTTTTTTTTLPPTTTTSTLVPAGIAALGDSDTDSRLPVEWIGGGFALLALALAGAYIYSRRRPAYGSASPGFMVAWRHRAQQRKAAVLSRPSRAAGISSWWRTSGPVTSYRERKDAKNAARDLQRRIEERRRLSGQ